VARWPWISLTATARPVDPRRAALRGASFRQLFHATANRIAASRPCSARRLSRLEQNGRQARGLEDSDIDRDNPPTTADGFPRVPTCQARPVDPRLLWPAGCAWARPPVARDNGLSTTEMLPPRVRRNCLAVLKTSQPVGYGQGQRDARGALWGAADPAPLRPRPASAPDSDGHTSCSAVTRKSPARQPSSHGNPSTSRRPGAARQDVA
jgi:hypothetical protein